MLVRDHVEVFARLLLPGLFGLLQYLLIIEELRVELDHIVIEQVLQLQGARNLGQGPIDNIARFFPLVAQHIIDRVAQSVLELLNAGVVVAVSELCIGLELHELLEVELDVAHLANLLEQHLNFLVNDALRRLSVVALRNQGEHLPEKFFHLNLHVFLGRFQLSHLHPVPFHSFFNALGQLFFVSLDLGHADVGALAQLLEALQLCMKLLRLRLQLQLHTVHLSVDHFDRIGYFVGLQAELRLQAVDFLETLLDG